MYKIKIILLLIIFASGCGTATKNENSTNAAPAKQAKSAPTGQFVKDYAAGASFKKYLLYLPADYGKPNKRFPLILFLHNARLRGDDIEKLKTSGLPQKLENDKNFPFIVVSPLCPENKVWTDDEKNLIEMLVEVEKNYAVDEFKVYLTGHSIGGNATWILAADYPAKFAAIAPLSNGADLSNEQIKNLSNMPIWAFHGGSDNIAPIAQHRKTIEAVKAAGNSDVKFTVLPGKDHFIQEDVYGNNELFDWFSAHSLLMR